MRQPCTGGPARSRGSAHFLELLQMPCPSRDSITYQVLTLPFTLALSNSWQLHAATCSCNGGQHPVVWCTLEALEAFCLALVPAGSTHVSQSHLYLKPGRMLVLDRCCIWGQQAMGLQSAPYSCEGQRMETMSTEASILLHTHLVLKEGDQRLVQRHQLLCLPHQAKALSICGSQRPPHINCRSGKAVW